MKKIFFSSIYKLSFERIKGLKNLHSRFAISLILGLFLICSCTIPAYSFENDENDNFYYTCFVKIHLTDQANQLNVFLSNYFKVFEKQDIDELKKLYSSNYISGDGFNKNQMIEMIQDSWDLSPNMEYSGEIQDIRFDKNFASVEINENAVGETKENSDITKDSGFIETTAKTILYLQKFGKGWKIISDKTIYEATSIKYGQAKNIDINLYAPDQVFPSKSYTISLESEIPETMFALGSIISEPLTYPRTKPEEVFRQIPSDTKLLERVVKVNKSSKNELAVASITFCNIKKSAYTDPKINIIGTAIVLKRVNVERIPILKE